MACRIDGEANLRAAVNRHGSRSVRRSIFKKNTQLPAETADRASNISHGDREEP